MQARRLQSARTFQHDFSSRQRCANEFHRSRELTNRSLGIADSGYRILCVLRASVVNVFSVSASRPCASYRFLPLLKALITMSLG